VRFFISKSSALSGLLCRVCDCEGTSRFPWAFFPVTGSYTRATGWRGRLSGWPSAVLSCLAPFAAQPRGAGACQGWRAGEPPGAQRRALALTPESLPAVYCEAFEGARQGEEGQPQAAPSRHRGAATPLGRTPRAAERTTPRPGTGRSGAAADLQERSDGQNAPAGVRGEQVAHDTPPLACLKQAQLLRRRPGCCGSREWCGGRCWCGGR
jgi:hypothetical protein